MKIPDNCPFCNEKIINKVNHRYLKNIVKACLDHKLDYYSNYDGELVYICGQLDPNIVIRWSMEKSFLKIAKSFLYEEKEFGLKEYPYFAPDFSDITKLIEKIKGIIAFS